MIMMMTMMGVFVVVVVVDDDDEDDDDDEGFIVDPSFVACWAGADPILLSLLTPAV